MGLREYKSKRDFRRTQEPFGRSGSSAKADPLTFVVQKHAASHLHYDFRLEMEGVLKSWAVPKGFPVKRGDRRLAVQVEDHPLEYGGFEGTIPEGNYGAGTVMVWDEGHYRVSGDDPVQALKSGKIHFALAGKKLKGEWALVRMRDSGEAKPQWLLLKSGSDVAPFSKRTEDRSALTGRSMHQITGASTRHEWESDRPARKRPRKQVGNLRPTANRASTGPRSKRRHARAETLGKPGEPDSTGQPTNKLNQAALAALPDRKPGFLEPMKSLLVDELPKGPGWLYEIKFDGIRALAIKDNLSLRLVSRSGKELGSKYGEVLAGLIDLPARQAVLDGEIVAVDAKGRSSFQLLQSYQSAGASKPPLFYYVFDLVQFEGKDLTGLPLWQRKAAAQNLTEGISPAIRFSENIKAESARLVKEMQTLGLEGLVAKKKDSKYEPGRRSGAWTKYKWTHEQEFVIGGYTHPKGSRSHFGAILVGYYQDGGLVFAGKVGTGFSDETLEILHKRFQKLLRSDCPFVNLPERNTGTSNGLGAAEMMRCTWLRPELVCQVRFAEWTRDYHLRQPAYLGLREDKKPREVIREEPS